MIHKHVDFEVGGFGELAGGPVLLPGLRASVLADGPLAYWRMGEGSGTVMGDETGDHDGVYVGSPTLGAGGAGAYEDNTAVVFDGVGSYADVGTLGALGSNMAATGVTVEMWLRTSSTGSIVRPLGVRNTSAKQFLFVGVNQVTTAQMNGWVGVLYRDESNKRVFMHAHIGSGLYDGEWHHLVCALVVSPGGGEVYFDSVAQGTVVTHDDGVVNAANFNQPIGVGCYLDRGSPVSHFPGTLDEFAVFEGVLSAARVRAHYLAGVGEVGG